MKESRKKVSIKALSSVNYFSNGPLRLTSFLDDHLLLCRRGHHPLADSMSPISGVQDFRFFHIYKTIFKVQKKLDRFMSENSFFYLTIKWSSF